MISKMLIGFVHISYIRDDVPQARSASLMTILTCCLCVCWFFGVLIQFSPNKMDGTYYRLERYGCRPMLVLAVEDEPSPSERHQMIMLMKCRESGNRSINRICARTDARYSHSLWDVCRVCPWWQSNCQPLSRRFHTIWNAAHPVALRKDL